MTASDATPDAGIFGLSRAMAEIHGWGFRHVATTGSTNVDLAEEARTGDRSACVLTADHQTAGRGRLDRRWEDLDARQLMVSFRLLAGSDPHWHAGAVAASARRAVAAAGAPVAFKWPNDLVLESGSISGKLAGVLAEYVPGSPDVVIVGIGLNVGSPEVEGAASLAEAGIAMSRDQVLCEMMRVLPALMDDPVAVRADLTANSATLGRRVRVERPDGDLIGDAVSIDDDGRLVLMVDGVEHRISVGDVVHLRPAG